jgi:predicted DNA-binding transcriptional regulator YafY
VEVFVPAPAPVVAAEVARWGTVTPRGDESCQLSMTVDDWEWVVLILASIGAEFDVISPPELDAHLRRIGELFGRARPEVTRSA